MTPDDRARKIETLIRNRMNGNQHQIATALGLSESSISRLKESQIAQFSLLLAHLGIKAVPVEMHVYDEDEINALLTIARKRLEQTKTIDSLGRDDY